MVMDDVNNTVGTKSSYTGCKPSNTGGKSEGKSENKQHQSFQTGGTSWSNSNSWYTSTGQSGSKWTYDSTDWQQNDV